MAEAKEKGQSIGVTDLNGLIEQPAKKYTGQYA
jgi:hypothetical protein